MLPHRRVALPGLEHAQHHKEPVLADVALGCVGACAGRRAADFDGVDVASGPEHDKLLAGAAGRVCGFAWLAVDEVQPVVDACGAGFGFWVAGFGRRVLAWDVPGQHGEPLAKQLTETKHFVVEI